MKTRDEALMSVAEQAMFWTAVRGTPGENAALDELARRVDEMMGRVVDDAVVGMVSTLSLDGSCDECGDPSVFQCGCPRCASEPTPAERFHACSAHREAVTATHARIRERVARWVLLDSQQT